MKHCYKCSRDLDESAFGRDRQRTSGLTYQCRECKRIQTNVRRRLAAGKPARDGLVIVQSEEERRTLRTKRNELYYQKHQEMLKARQREWNKANSEHIKARSKEYYDENKVEVLKAQKAYNANHRDQNREWKRGYCKGRMRNDPIYRMKKNLRRRMLVALSGKRKCAATFELVGCSVEELKSHLEARFLPGMNWANRQYWHVDHIRPCASFDLSRPEEQRACFHFANLQPLWAADNIRKKDKMPCVGS